MIIVHFLIIIINRLNEEEVKMNEEERLYRLTWGSGFSTDVRTIGDLKDNFEKRGHISNIEFLGIAEEPTGHNRSPKEKAYQLNWLNGSNAVVWSEQDITKHLGKALVGIEDLGMESQPEPSTYNIEPEIGQGNGSAQNRCVCGSVQNVKGTNEFVFAMTQSFFCAHQKCKEKKKVPMLIGKNSIKIWNYKTGEWGEKPNKDVFPKKRKSFGTYVLTKKDIKENFDALFEDDRAYCIKDGAIEIRGQGK